MTEFKDTRGWHFDEHEFSMVYAAKMPEQGQGGVLECIEIPEAERNNAESPALSEKYTDKIRQIQLAPGELCILRSGALLHRVSPLKEGAKERQVIVLSKDVSK